MAKAYYLFSSVDSPNEPMLVLFLGAMSMWGQWKQESEGEMPVLAARKEEGAK